MVIEFREMNPTKLSKKANSIYNTFLKPQSTYELNCQQEKSEKVQEQIENNHISNTMFDSIYKEVESNLKGTLLNFLMSQEYKDYLDKKSQTRERSKSIDEDESTGVPKRSCSIDVICSTKLKRIRTFLKNTLTSHHSPELFIDENKTIQSKSETSSCITSPEVTKFVFSPL